MFNNFSKLGQILSLAILFTPAISSMAVAEGEGYYNFPTGNHEGGGTRGRVTSCATNANYPVPIVPQNIKTLTASASPELLFQVPDVVQASTLEVILLDLGDRVVYRNGLKTGDRSGIIGLNLADESNSDTLKVDSLYHWYLIQECENSAELNIVANGTLQRIELDKESAQKIDNASGLEKIKLYRQANIWHEAIANLAQMKCNSAEDLLVSQQWIDEEFTDVPSLSDRSFNSYCLNDSEVSVVIQ